MKTGAFSAFALAVATAPAILAGLISVGPLALTPSTGSLGALAVQSLRAVEGNSDALAIIDYGGNRVCIAKHTAGNVTALKAVLNALSGVVKYTLVPDSTAATSASFDVKTSAGVSVLGSFTLGTQAGAFETAIAAALNPGPTTKTAQAVLDAVENALTAAQKEAFVLVDTNTFEFDLYIVTDTSAARAQFANEAAFNAISGVTADSHIASLEMTPAAGVTVAKSII